MRVAVHFWPGENASLNRVVKTALEASLARNPSLSVVSTAGDVEPGGPTILQIEAHREERVISVAVAVLRESSDAFVPMAGLADLSVFHGPAHDPEALAERVTGWFDREWAGEPRGHPEPLRGVGS